MNIKKISLQILIGYILILIIISFIPFKNLYYLSEQSLKSYKLFINEKSIDSFFVSTSVNEADVYFEAIQALSFESMSLSVWLLHNSIDIENAKVAEALSDFLPLNIKFINISYSVFNLLKIKIESQGDFGSLEGSIDLLSKKIYIEMTASKQMQQSFSRTTSLMKKVKTKDKTNRYSYEHTFK